MTTILYVFPLCFGAQCCRPTGSSGANVTGFGTIELSRSGYAGREHDVGSQMLRSVSEEGRITLDNVDYTIGGLSGQTDFAFINNSLVTELEAASNSFVYKQYRTGAPTKRYEWTPGMRFSGLCLNEMHLALITPYCLCFHDCGTTISRSYSPLSSHFGNVAALSIFSRVANPRLCAVRRC